MNNDTKRDITHGLPAESIVRHGIQYGNFDSQRFNLHLHERIGNTPSEKEIITSIPYMQGIVDLSDAIGNRIYENREISYTFYRFGVAKDTARDVQTTLTNLLMSGFNQRLDDSFEPDFHYTGKCRDVIVDDEYYKNRLRIEITFDLYPFKIDNHMESGDLFDPFNFDLDAFQGETKEVEKGLTFEIEGGERYLQLYNTSQLTLRPWIEVFTSGVTLIMGEDSHPLQVGRHRYPYIRLKPGFNEISLRHTGTGYVTVAFDWRKERI